MLYLVIARNVKDCNFCFRAYILNSLAAKNNLEFFIEGGRTRTGKPQPPKGKITFVNILFFSFY